MRSTPCYTSSLEARARQPWRETAKWCILHSVHLSASKAKIMAAVLLIAYVTSEKEKEDYSEVQ